VSVCEVKKPWEHGKDLVFILSEVESNCKDISDQSGCSNEMTYKCPGGGKRHPPACTWRNCHWARRKLHKH